MNNLMSCKRWSISIVMMTVIFYMSLLNAIQGEKAMRFQASGVPTTDSTMYYLLNPSSEIYLTSFSFSLWIKVDRFRDTTYITSYTTSDKLTNLLNLFIREDLTSLAVQSKKVSIKKHKIKLSIDTWYHFASVVDGSSQTLKVFVNGQVVYEASLVPFEPLQLNGSMILGQEADAFNGGFVKEQSFCGLISDFNLYGRSLTVQEIESLYSCTSSSNKLQEAIVIPWNSTRWVVSGEVEEEEVEICNRKINDFVLFLQKKTSIQARQECKALLRSEIYRPNSEDLNKVLYQESRQYSDQCVSSNHATGYIHLGITDKKEEGTWKGFDSAQLNYTNFGGSGVTSSQDCAVMEIPPSNGLWNDVFCNEHSYFCFPCSISTPGVSLFMRGLCERRKLHQMFGIGELGEANTRKIKGFGKHDIFYNELNQTWYLVNLWTNTLMASYYSIDASYPIGKKVWNIETDFALCDQPKDKQYTLVLSTCTDEEFTCDMGYCIPLIQRCDLRAQCPDQSDENDCEKILPTKDYLSHLPPGGLNGNEALAINLSLIIERFSKIDVRNMRLTVDFIVSLTWFDSRFTFANLNAKKDINIIQTDGVWVPEFDFTNADYPEVFRSTPILSVVKLTAPIEDAVSRPLRDELYEGAANPLNYEVRAHAPIFCDMDLSLFPFDNQICRMDIRIKSVRSSFVAWSNMEVLYTGEIRLSEYEVLDMTTNITDEGEFSLGSVKFTLSRRYAFYVSSVYLPSFMLLWISFASLYCRLEDCDLRVMMTITTLLVLYSLYQQISDGLPKTSYVKAIDLWCFFSLVVIFSEIIFHVFVDLKIDSKIGNSTIFGISSFKNPIYNDSHSLKKLRRVKLARIFYLVLIISFFLVYCVYVIVNMYTYAKV